MHIHVAPPDCMKRKPLDLKCMPNILNIRKRKTQSNLSGSPGFILVRTPNLNSPCKLFNLQATMLALLGRAPSVARDWIYDSIAVRWI